MFSEEQILSVREELIKASSDDKITLNKLTVPFSPKTKTNHFIHLSTKHITGKFSLEMPN